MRVVVEHLQIQPGRFGQLYQAALTAGIGTEIALDRVDRRHG